ncbi:MAG: hypothetical protein ACOYM2_11195, partial [Rectinemataceae bacterium]
SRASHRRSSEGYRRSWDDGTPGPGPGSAGRMAEQALFGDAVAAAPGSAAKDREVAGKRTDDNLPVHSFQSLLKDLATLTLNTMTTVKDATFTMLATPTRFQTMAF